jgi:hypothetical protein
MRRFISMSIPHPNGMASIYPIEFHGEIAKTGFLEVNGVEESAKEGICPKGFLHACTSVFSNRDRSFSRISGCHGTIDGYGGEGASLFMVSSEGGRQVFDPTASRPMYTQVPIEGPWKDKGEIVQAPGASAPNSLGPDEDDANHWMNWLKVIFFDRLFARHAGRLPSRARAVPSRPLQGIRCRCGRGHRGSDGGQEYNSLPVTFARVDRIDDMRRIP